MFWLVSTIATTANIRIWSKYITENSVPNEYIYQQRNVIVIK